MTKKKLFVLEMAALLLFIFVLAGCPSGGGSSPWSNGGKEDPLDPNDGGENTNTHLLSGTFGGMKFLANLDSSANQARSLLSSETQQLIGFLELSMGNIVTLTGFIDEETGNFILTGMSETGDTFMLSGLFLQGAWEGNGATWVKEGNQWIFINESLDFNDSVDFEFPHPTVHEGRGFPEAWWGKWDYSQEGQNAGAVESWLTSHGERGDYCMIISQYGLSMWIDIATLEEWQRGNIEGYAAQEQEMIAGMTPEELEEYMSYYNGGIFWTPEFQEENLREFVEGLQGQLMTLHVLEIDEKSANVYEALVGVYMPVNHRTGYWDDVLEEWVEDITGLVFRKIRFNFTQFGRFSTLMATLGVHDNDPYNECDHNTYPCSPVCIDVRNAEAAMAIDNWYFDPDSGSTTTLVMEKIVE